MGKSRGALRIVSDPYYAGALSELFDTAARSEEPVQACLEAMVTIAEPDPQRARRALWRLQTDWKALRSLERGLGGDPTQAALRIGAAIQLVRTELNSPTPQLRRRLPEIMEWLGRRQLSTAE